MKVSPYFRHFLDADDGGGSAAVIDAPAESTPSADAVLAELGSFEVGVPDFDAPEKPETPVEKPAEPKPPEQPKPEDQKSQKEPPAKQLRDELERTRKERDEFREKFEKHPRVSELEQSMAERQKELEKYRTEAETARRELEIRDPLASSKLVEHQQSFNAEYQRGIDLVPEIEGSYQSLVQEFGALPRENREQYREALAAFETELEAKVGPRKVAAALDMIRKGHEFVGEHNKLRQDVTQNASKLAYESRETEWKKQDQEVSTLLTDALNVPDDLAETDPYNPALFVKKALAEVDESKQKEVVSTIDNFVKRAFTPPKPRTEKDFPGLSQAEVQERIQAEQKLHVESKQAAIRMMKQGMLALTMMRPVMTELAKLRERVAKEAESLPRNPNEGADTPAGNSDDLSTYTPPSISI